ncbi:hypothetical protein HPB48_007814 [Haemaphysalis longicornis]|uniref:Ig-like domain-containing protein n=1 Tax=Haemaphysalis longicornis TaxID=44386 RepID=A0A9J6G196_HAELO|nr:hypothetical protein HPB48_007814 [Haemaphysalis longicornis]
MDSDYHPELHGSSGLQPSNQPDKNGSGGRFRGKEGLEGKQSFSGITDDPRRDSVPRTLRGRRPVTASRTFLRKQEEVEEAKEKVEGGSVRESKHALMAPSAEVSRRKHAALECHGGCATPGRSSGGLLGGTFLLGCRSVGGLSGVAFGGGSSVLRSPERLASLLTVPVGTFCDNVGGRCSGGFFHFPILTRRSLAHVTALAGGEALLPCDLSPDNDSVALVLWYKDALPTPVYSVDARRGDVSQARHSSIAWGPRAYFATQPAPGLRLQALAVGDSGVYRCRVDFRKDRTRNHETSLVVIGKFFSSRSATFFVNYRYIGYLYLEMS